MSEAHSRHGADGPTLAERSRGFLACRVSTALSGYEARPSQLAFMDACAHAVDAGGLLLAEAGTGTGKTFAYLIPVILSGKRAVISTKTKNLQEQLFRKDLGFLSGLAGFRFALLKGRGNYACLRRLRALDMVPHEELADLQRTLSWVDETETGDLDEVTLSGSALKSKICSDSDACLRTACSFYGACFYFSARKKAEKAQCVVVNHALLSVNAVLPDDARVLPDAEVLVIDEAHALDLILTEKAGAAVSAGAVTTLLSVLAKKLVRGRPRGRGAAKSVPAGIAQVKAESDVFWERVSALCSDRVRVRGAFSLGEEARKLSSALRDLVNTFSARKSLDLFNENEKAEINGVFLKVLGAADSLRGFCEDAEGQVRWVEVEKNDVTLRTAPINSRRIFAEGIMPRHETVVLTSATLSERGDFTFIDSLLGTEGAARVAVASPFDLNRQVQVHVTRGMDPAGEDAPRVLSHTILDQAAVKDGGILVLFTSRSMMGATWRLSAQGLADLGLTPMLQGSLPHAEMLQRMRESGSAVLFGLDSFWEGIDVRGDALKCVIITKLPFDVPTEPVTEARLEEIRKQGGNPFLDYSLPRAILKFRQGVGRLIRSCSDTGRVVICDERIVSKAYGRRFLDSLW